MLGLTVHVILQPYAASVSAVLKLTFCQANAGYDTQNKQISLKVVQK